MAISTPRVLTFALLLPLSACTTSAEIEATRASGFDVATMSRDAAPPADRGAADIIDAAPQVDDMTLCTPSCGARTCGDDGCGGVCGDCDGPNDLCVSGTCACIPNCDGLLCGDDGCGGSCGACHYINDVCISGLCECAPDCIGLECGDDDCGGSCGGCLEHQICQSGSCDCVPDCAGAECGSDGCGGDCGACSEGEACSEGACACVPDCEGAWCGADGCGGVCGQCEPETERCDALQRCVFIPCDTSVCGVCDQLDVLRVVGGSGTLGGSHPHGVIPEVFRSWPITSDLEIFSVGGGTAFRIHHLPGEALWPTVNGADGNPYGEAAVIIACYDKPGVGVYCASGEHWSMDHNDGVRGMDWPAARPVAWVLVSSGAQKRTAIKYFDTWPHNNLPADHAINPSTVGLSLDQRACR